MTESREKMPDMSAVRCAVEHACSHQEIPLPNFAAYVAVYLVDLVRTHCSDEQAQAVINTAQGMLNEMRDPNGRWNKSMSKH